MGEIEQSIRRNVNYHFRAWCIALRLEGITSSDIAIATSDTTYCVKAGEKDFVGSIPGTYKTNMHDFFITVSLSDAVKILNNIFN